MKIINVIPKESIGEIKLGMDREKVHALLGNSKNVEENSEWIENYHIQYRDNKVIFIELASSVSRDNFVLYNSVDLFRTEVKLLINFVSNYGELDEANFELGYSYTFPELGLGMWRPMIFEYEMINNSEYLEMCEENQLEELKHLYFKTICIFEEGYYEK